MKYFFCILLSCLCITTYAQTSYQFRYWFDDKPDEMKVVTATSMTDSLSRLELAADVSSLDNYLHTIHFQVGDEVGGWSVPITRFFLKMSQADTHANLMASKMRYWFDGKSDELKTVSATSMVDSLSLLELAADVSSLDNYLHTIHFQMGDEKVGWSVPITRFFLKMSKADAHVNLMASKMRYWFDGKSDELKTISATNVTDSLSLLELAADVSSLDNYLHTIHFQMGDEKVGWSVPITRFFMKMPQLETDGSDYAKVTILYCFDEGRIQQTQGEVVGGELQLNLDVSKLSVGTHVLTFTIRNEQMSLMPPVQAEFAKNTQEKTLQLTLHEGWNWISSSFISDNLNKPQTLLANVLDNIVVVKGQTQLLVNDPEHGWMGDLTEIEPSQAYKVQVTQELTLSLYGLTASLVTTPINLVKGWNWIGYLPTDTLLLTDALSELQPSEGDIIKSKTKFAVFEDDMFRGDLQWLEPGQGYMYYAHSDATFHYTYPSDSSSKIRKEKPHMQSYDIDTPWTTDVYRYPDNMTMIASVSDVEQDDWDKHYVLAAFCNDECRGVGSFVEGRIFLTIHGTTVEQEQIRFRLYDRNECRELTIKENLVFGNKIEGTFKNPVKLHLDDTSSIDSAATAADNHSTEYYTLQGVRVSTPVGGQTYIVVIRTNTGRIVRKVLHLQ